MHPLNNEESERVFEKKMDIINKVLIMFTCVVLLWDPILTLERASFSYCHAYARALTVLSCIRRKATAEFSGKRTFHSFP